MAILPSGSPSCAAAAPSASEVCRGSAPGSVAYSRGSGQSRCERRAPAAERPGDLLDTASRAASARRARHTRDTPAATGPRTSHRCATAEHDAPDVRRPRRLSVRGGGADAAAHLAKKGLPGDAARAARHRGHLRAGQFSPELVPLLPIAIPVSVRALMLAAQPLSLTALTLDLALLSFELGDQLFARCHASCYSHASLMPPLDQEYKWKLRRSRRSDGGSEGITR